MSPINAVMRIKVITCRVVSRNDGSYHVDTSEHDDGWDGIGERCLQPWMALGYSSQIMQQLFPNHGVEDSYDGNDEEHNDTFAFM